MHELIVGKTGVGKSTHVENKLLACAGGFTFLDPHGQSAEKIADSLRPVIYWEPFDPTCPVAINPLEAVADEVKPLLAEQTVSAIKSAYPDNWGPNLEDILRNAIYLLLYNSLPLTRLPQILTDKSYRAKLLFFKHADPTATELRRFWLEEFPARKNPDDEVRSTLNKVRILALNPVLRRVLSHNTLNLAHLMNTGQRLVVNLSVSRMGEKPASLLGALIANGIYHAALSRSVIAESERLEHRLVIDEWQNFATTTFNNILSEARKFGLYLTLLNQLTAQIADIQLKTVLGNIGRLTVFRVAYDDANILKGELGLRLPEQLTDLGNFEYYERTGLTLLTHNSEPSPPSRGYLAGNRAHTRARYGRPT